MVETIDNQLILSDINDSIKNLSSIIKKIDVRIESVKNIDNITKISKFFEYISYFDNKKIEIDKFLIYALNYDRKKLNKRGKQKFNADIDKIRSYKIIFDNKISFFKTEITNIYIARHGKIMGSVNLFSIGLDKLIQLYNINTYELMDFLQKNDISIIEIDPYSQKHNVEDHKTEGPKIVHLVTSEKINRSIIAKTKIPEMKEFGGLKTNKNGFISIALLGIDAGNRRADAIKQLLLDPVSGKIAIISVLRDIKVKKGKTEIKINDINDENGFKQIIEDITGQDVVYTSRFNMNTVVSEFDPSFRSIFPDGIGLGKLTDKYLLDIGGVEKKYDKNAKIDNMNELLQLIRARHHGWLLKEDGTKKQKIDLFGDILRSKRQGEIINSILSQFISNLSLSRSIDGINQLPKNFLKDREKYVGYTDLTIFAKNYYTKFGSNASSQSIEPKIDRYLKGSLQINVNDLRGDIKKFFEG